MMNGAEKSDPSIVARKLVNKSGQPGAESAERKEGAEENTDEPHTYRTPSRASVSLGLDHVRQAAKAGKKERFKATLRRRMHDTIPRKGQWLRQVVRGYFNYHAVPTNAKRLRAFRTHVIRLWRRTLRRRSQKDNTTWARMAQLAVAFLPVPHILHPLPHVRFAVKHPRWEPGA